MIATDINYWIREHSTRSTFSVRRFGSSVEIGKCVYRLDNKRKNSASIWSMYIKPDYRRLGAASRLIVFCKQRALIDGVKVLWLSVAETNAAARQLYEKSGFEVVEKLDERHKKGRVIYEWRPRE